MKVADLYAGLSLKLDHRSFHEARKQFTDLAKDYANGSVFQRRTMGSRVKGFLGRDISEGLRSVRRMALVAGGATAVAGYAFGKAAKDALQFDDALHDFQISSDGSTIKLGELRAATIRASNATGLAKEDVLAMARQYVGVTGDADGAVKAMGQFARVAIASRAPVEDVATAAASLKQQLNIQPEQMEKAFSVLSTAGKLGKVELKDFAGLFASVGANFKQFAGSQSIKGLTEVSASLQFAAQNFGTPSEAATGLQQLMGTLIHSAEKLHKVGVDIYEKDPATGEEHLKNFSEIVGLIADNPKLKNKTLLSHVLGGRKEAKMALEALMSNRHEVAKMAHELEGADNIGKDFNARQKTGAAQIKKAWNEVKNSIFEAFTPERIEAFTTFLKAAIDVASKLVDTLMHVPGYMEFLAGEGKVANADAQDAFEDFAKHPGVQKAAGTKDRVAIAKMIKAGTLPGGVGGSTQEIENIKRGAQALVSQSKTQRKQDMEKGWGSWRGFGTGDRLSPDFYGPATGPGPAYDDTAPAGVSIGTITVNGAGADPETVANKVVKKIDERTRAEQRRATAAAGGN